MAGNQPSYSSSDSLEPLSYIGWLDRRLVGGCLGGCLGGGFFAGGFFGGAFDAAFGDGFLAGDGFFAGGDGFFAGGDGFFAGGDGFLGDGFLGDGFLGDGFLAGDSFFGDGCFSGGGFLVSFLGDGACSSDRRLSFALDLAPGLPRLSSVAHKSGKSCRWIFSLSRCFLLDGGVPLFLAEPWLLGVGEAGDLAGDWELLVTGLFWDVLRTGR